MYDSQSESFGFKFPTVSFPVRSLRGGSIYIHYWPNAGCVVICSLYLDIEVEPRTEAPSCDTVVGSKANSNVL